MLKHYLSGFTKAPLVFTSLFIALALPFISLPEFTSALCTKGTHCDNWGAPEYSGSSWFNGGGVEVYSNGTQTGVWDPNTSTYDVKNYPGFYNCFTISGGVGGQNCSSGTVPTGIEWQCVELFNRFYMTKGWITSEWTGNGNQLINKSPFPTGFSQQASNAVTYVNPGDAITFDDGGAGHVAIVNTVSGGTIQVVSQNTDGTTFNVSWNTTTNTLTQTYLTGYGVQAIIHAPNGGTPSSGTLLAVADHSNGEQDVFWRDSSSNLREAYYASGWHGPVGLGMGPLGSPPTAAVRPSTNEQDVFWKGGDGNLWEAYYNGSWHGPTNLGMGPLGSQPAATAWGSEVDVFWKGADGNLWEAWQNSGAWNGPKVIGMGPLSSAPTAAAHANGEQDVFWEGSDSNLWEAYYANSAWNGPYDVGMGPLGSPPTADVQPTSGEEDVFWEGGDQNIWQAYWSGSWHGPLGLGKGPLGSPPSVSAWGSEVDIFWRGGDSNLWESWGNTGGWNGPASPGMGPIPAS